MNEPLFPDGITLRDLRSRVDKMDLRHVIGDTPVLVLRPGPSEESPLFVTPEGGLPVEAETTFLGDTSEGADEAGQRAGYAVPSAVAVAVTKSNRSPDDDEEVVTIGRGLTNDIRLVSGQVSKLHATLTRVKRGGQGDVWQLSDMGSANGTWLNGLRLEPQRGYFLRPSDELGFADVRAVFLDAEGLVNLCHLIRG